MSRGIEIVPVGPVEADTLAGLGRGLTRAFGVPSSIEGTEMDPAFAFHPERGQHHATEILARLAGGASQTCWRRLGVTNTDLYIPILTFVFGEAQLEGPCAVVSLHRLRQQFYGLPPDGTLLADRLLKESIHEIGHTLGLAHCPDWGCAMASSHSVDLIDLKRPELCAACSRTARAAPPRQRP